MKALSRLSQVLLVGLGLLATALGIIGVFLPILPTTPFLLLAAGLFVRSSPGLHQKLVSHPKFGPAIIQIQEGKGIRLKTKLISTTVAGSMIGAFAIWGTSSLHLRIFLAVLIAVKIGAMIAIPTYRPENSKADGYKISAPRLMTLAVFITGTIFVAVQVLFVIELGNWVFSALQGNMSFPTLLAVLVAGRWALMILNRWLGGQISRTVRLDARQRLFLAIAGAGPDAVREAGLGKYQELLNERVESLDPMYSLFFPQLFIGILSPVVVVLMIMRIDMTTALLILAVIPVSPLILGMLAKSFARVGKEYSKSAAELGAWYVESIRALPTLTLFQRITSYRQKLAQSSTALKDRTIRLLVVNQLSLLLVEIFFSLAMIGFTAWLGVQRFQAGYIPAAFAIILPLLAIELIRPINLVGAFFFAGAAGRQSKKMITAEVRRLEELHPVASVADSPEAHQRDIELTVPDEKNRGLRVRKVSFAYPAAPERKVLSSVSLEVLPGEILGLKGPSGSGKSTLAKLILGYYQPQSGVISVDGVDLATASSSGSSSATSNMSLGYLPQRPYIFNRSLRENIAMGRANISDDQIWAALDKAGLDYFRERGLDAVLGEDAGQISGGERMRIALARVLVGEPSYIVLDEPTAEIDSDAERHIWQALEACGSGILVIAHRRTTLESCHRIVDLQSAQLSTGVLV